ncbi:MAG: restriction endonuclease subunit S [Bacteroidota bacterium]
MSAKTLDKKRTKVADNALLTNSALTPPTQNNVGLPDGWRWIKLGEICETTSGGTPSRQKASYYNGNIPWVKSGELNNGLILDTEEKISEDAIKNSSAKIFPKGTLLIALYGATIGKLAFLGVDAATNQAVCGIFKNDNIDSKYLYHFLFFSKQDLVNQGIGGAQPNISQGILKGLEIPLPAIKDQHAIVSKIEELLSELDKGKQQLETAQQQLKIYRQAVLKWAFEGKLTNENVKEGELPQGWRIVELKELVDKISDGPFGSHLKSIDYVDEGIRVVRLENIGEMEFRDEYKTFVTDAKYETIKGHTVTRGDIIFSSFISESIRSVILPDFISKAINKADCFLVRVSESRINRKYLVYYFSTRAMRNQLVSHVHGATRPRINTSQLKASQIPLAPLKEQHHIVQEIESRLSVCDKVEETIVNSLQQAETLRQSILKKAFEGKLV